VNRPLPWKTREPGHGGYQWCVLDADGWPVCECDGEDDGKGEAEAIVAAVNGARSVARGVLLDNRAGRCEDESCIVRSES
jgi:hypothetical protein